MHLNTEELLAVRDGEAAAEAVRHTAGCPECAAEIARLRALQGELAALPELRPAADGWPAARAALAARRTQRRWIAAGWAAAGLAATFTIAIGVRGGIDSWHEARMARETRQVVAESQRLETALRTLQAQGSVMNGRTAGAIVQLEDRIDVIDAQLARAGTERYPSREVLGLWQERVQLLDAIVGLQTTRAAYMGL